MNKAELIRQVAEQTGFTKKETETILNTAIDQITAALAQGERVQLVGFGSFEVKARSARQGRNLQTGEIIPIPPTRGVQFTAGKALKSMVKGTDKGESIL